MAVKIYKDGESELCEPQYLDAQLAAGWSVTEDSEDGIDDFDITELRALGVEKGIEDAETMHHATLKKLLKES